jgi:AcrR family transcriptional regulator
VPRQGLGPDRVVDAAEELGADGLDGVTFARLAAHLGVRPPSLYNHVDSRPALLRLIALRGIAGLSDAVTTATAGLAGPEALRAMGRAYRAYAQAHPARYEATLAAPIGDAELEAAGARGLAIIAAVMRGWQLEGDDEIDAIRVVRSALHGFVSLDRAGGFMLARSLDASFERLLDVLVAGLSAP